MHPVPVLCGIGCVVAFGLATYSRDPDARLLAVEIAAVWAGANALWLFNALQYLPALDWIVGVQALVMSITRRERWIKFFLAVIVLRLSLHVVDYLTAQAFLVQYIHGLNATFALLLMVVSYGGGAHARDTLLGYLHRHGSGLRASLRASSPGLNP